MRIFVSSRIGELFVERKVAIDAIHACGHTPVYIETEPEVRDDEAVNTMKELLNGSDAFLLMYYLSLGKRDQRNGNNEIIMGGLAPIQFEYNYFKSLHGKNNDFTFLKKQHDEILNFDPYLNLWINQINNDHKGLKVGEFQTFKDLTKEIEKFFGSTKTDNKPLFCYRYNMKFAGPDYIGLIYKISNILFNENAFNVEYISHASRSGSSTIYLTFSKDRHLSNTEIDEIKSDVKKEVKLDVEKLFYDIKLRHRVTPNAILEKDKIRCDITELNEQLPDYQFYVEIRAIDTPGQLNAICRELTERDYNIDELVLKPTDIGHKRQTLLSLWISNRSVETKTVEKCRVELMRLETLLSLQIGIKTFSARLVINNENLYKTNI